MSISERIGNTFEAWSVRWKDKLRGWSLRVIAEGITSLLEGLEEEARPSAEDFITRFPIHPEVKKELEAFLAKKSPIMLPAWAMMAIGVVIGSLVGTFMGWAAPIAKWTSYQGEKVIKSYRLDPYSIITAWRRDKPKYEHLFEDLRDQGWNDERIDDLKFFTLVYPSRQDLIRYVAREALEPESIAKYGLMDEFDRLDLSIFEKIGVPEETVKLDWIAHWEHASWMQIVEMLHRGLLTEEEVWEWFRLVEIPPFWRQPLIDSAYTWPTRVDVRRWWDMRTIDETELRRLYSGMGYRGVNLDNYVKWTKVYTDFPMMMTRFTNGWITEEDIRSWLRGLEIPEERIEQFIQEKTKPEAPARVANERDLTAAEIMKGVKKGVLEEYEGVELLQDMGYSEDEAWYKIEIDKAVAAGSPETFAEFKDLTQRYKLAIGKEVKPMPEELKKAAAEVVRITGEVESLEGSINEEKRGLVDEEVLPEATTRRLKGLQVKLHRAESELARVKSEYDRLVAEWRHGLP